MPSDLTVRFEFLCAFVPPKLFPEGPDHCWVILPDFSKLEPASKRHFSYVVFSKRQRVNDAELEQAGLEPRPLSPQPSVGTKLAVIDCAAEDIEILPDGKKATTTTLKLNGDLSALLRIAKAGLGHELLDKRLLNAPDNGIVRLAARLHLREGTLATDAVTAPFGIYREGEAKEVTSQPMARRVTLKIPSVNFVDLVFRPMSVPNPKARVLRLRANANEPVIVRVRNCEKKFKLPDTLPPLYQQSQGEMNLFFPLAAGFNPSAKLPEITLKGLQDAGNGICAPKTFDGAK